MHALIRKRLGEEKQAGLFVPVFFLSSYSLSLWSKHKQATEKRLCGHRKLNNKSST